MLTYSFENLQGMPLYEYLYRCIRRDIETGGLKPGEKLPSKRSLARHLGVSTITVEGAYGQLVAEGYCTSQPKRGYYVTAGLPVSLPAELQSRSQSDGLVDSLANLDSRSQSARGIPPDKQTLSASALRGRLCRSRQKVDPAGLKIFGETPRASRSYQAARGNETASFDSCSKSPPSRSDHVARGSETAFFGSCSELSSSRSDHVARGNKISFSPSNKETGSGLGGGDSSKSLIDFAEGAGNAENFPFALWTKLLRRVVAEEAAALVVRSPAAGVWKLRTAIADHLLRFRGLAVRPEQVVVGAGTEYLYGLLVQFFGRARRFCVENPGYGRIQRIYESCGARCLLAGMDEAGVRPDELVRQEAEIVHISPSHHYPTGLIMPISRRYELLGWAAKDPGRFILEDDYDSEFRLTGRPIPTLMGIDRTGCVLYMNTFSKSLTPTIRISYLVLPERLVAPFREKLGFYSCTVSNFEQYTLARFLADGHFERHIHRMRTLYRRRREMILSLLKHAPFARQLDLMERGSGLHFLVRFRAAGTTEAIREKLAAAGIRMKALADCYVAADEKNTPGIQEKMQGVFVLDYSSVGEEEMREAVERIGQALY